MVTTESEFVETELGQLPKDWPLKKLEDVTTTITDYVANGSFASLKENVKYLDEEGYAILLRLTDYSNGFEGPFRYVDRHAYEFLSKSSVKPGDIIMSNVGSIGTIFKAPNLNKPMTLGPNAILIKANDFNDFLFFWFQSSIGKESVYRIASKTAQPKFNKTDFRNLPIPVPPTSEQHAITKILSTVRQAIDATEEVIAAARELKRSMMKHLFTYGPVPVDRADQIDIKETPIGYLPADWKVVKMDSVTKIILGQSPPSSTYNKEGDGPEFLQGKAEFGDIYPSPIKWCSQPKRIARKGSILISVRAPVGDVNIARGDYCIGRGLASIDGYESLDNWYLFYQLIFAKNRLEEKGTGSTFKSINKGILQQFNISLPTIKEQHDIKKFLCVIEKKINTEISRRNSLGNLFSSLLHHLMTGKLRVPYEQ